MSLNRNQLVSYIPPVARDDVTVSYLVGTAHHFFTLEEVLRDIQRQTIPSQATWALPLYERELGLMPKPSDSLEKRRRKILATRDREQMNPKRFLQLVNRYMRDNTATIKRETKEYKMIIRLPVDDVLSLKDVTEAVLEVLPANTDLERQGLIQGTLRLRHKEYHFPVEYRKTNQFQTAAVNGGLGKAPFDLTEKSYGFDVFFPICNTFNTSPVAVEQEQINVMLTEEYRDNDILYKRTGAVYIGEGAI